MIRSKPSFQPLSRMRAHAHAPSLSLSLSLSHATSHTSHTSFPTQQLNQQNATIESMQRHEGMQLAQRFEKAANHLQLAVQKSDDKQVSADHTASNRLVQDIGSGSLSGAGSGAGVDAKGAGEAAAAKAGAVAATMGSITEVMEMAGDGWGLLK